MLIDSLLEVRKLKELGVVMLPIRLPLREKLNVNLWGLPIYILFWIGIASFISKSITKNISKHWFILILGTTGVFILAHSIFWTFGIFNSMGLIRVLICIVPLIVLIALQGFNTVINQYNGWINKGQLIFKSLIILALVGFQFIPNHSSIHWERDLSLLTDQQCALDVAQHLEKRSLTDKKTFYAHPYLSVALNKDPYDNELSQKLTLKHLDSIQTGELVIWENWFAVLEEGINKDRFSDTTLFQPIYTCNKNDEHRLVEYAVYLRK